MRKSTKRNLIVIVVAVLLAVFFTSLIGSLTNGFQDIELGKEVNPDNLISCDEDKIVAYLESGVAIAYKSDYDVDVTSKGVVKVKGENTTESDVNIEIWSSDELVAGTYTFSCEVDGEFEGEVVIAKASAGEPVAVSYVPCEDNTIVVNKGESVKVIIVIPAETEVDASFYPVLVEGEEEGSFYVD